MFHINNGSFSRLWNPAQSVKYKSRQCIAVLGGIEFLSDKLLHVLYER